MCGLSSCSEKPKELKKPKRWVPRVDESYYYLDSYNGISLGVWDNDRWDLMQLAIRNVYKTQELAQIQADKNALIAEIFNYCDERNFELAGPDYEETVYYFEYDRDEIK